MPNDASRCLIHHCARCSHYVLAGYVVNRQYVTTISESTRNLFKSGNGGLRGGSLFIVLCLCYWMWPDTYSPTAPISPYPPASPYSSSYSGGSRYDEVAPRNNNHDVSVFELLNPFNWLRWTVSAISEFCWWLYSTVKKFLVVCIAIAVLGVRSSHQLPSVHRLPYLCLICRGVLQPTNRDGGKHT